MTRWATMLLDGSWTMAIGANEEVIRDDIRITDMSGLLHSGLTVIPATVPGNFELDMQRAGLIGDPFWGTNIIQMQELENRHIWYGRTFIIDKVSSDTFFVFEGIDTYSEMFLNGEMIASTDNMLIPHEIRAEGVRAGENELIVHIRPARIEAMKHEIDAGCFAMKYNWESLQVRKASHMYGWDIMPRAISAGIWRSVSIIDKPKDRIDDIFIFTKSMNRDGKYAELTVNFKTHTDADSLRGMKLSINGKCGGSSFSVQHKLMHTSGKFNVFVGDAMFWWPAGSGDAALYETTVDLYRDDVLLDSFSLNVGIRKVELLRTSTTDKNGNGQFLFRINYENIFIKGTNWVPVDAYHSRDRERIIPALQMVKDVGCNAIRCWGGNVYEDPILYD